MTEPMSTVENYAQIEANAGQAVWVIGRYTLLENRSNAGIPPVQHGLAALIMADGTPVMLEPAWSPEAVRPDDERRRLTGKLVAASGKILPRPPSAPGDIADLQSPCLVDIRTLKELPESSDASSGANEG